MPQKCFFCKKRRIAWQLYKPAANVIFWFEMTPKNVFFVKKIFYLAAQFNWIMTYQAHHLLEWIITVRQMTATLQHSDSEDIWFFDRYLNHLPIYYRLRQIEALTKALGIYQAPTTDKSHFKRLLQGDFLENTPYIISYPDLAEAVKEFYEASQYPVDDDMLYLRMHRIYPTLLADLLKLHVIIRRVGRIGLETFTERLFRHYILRKIDFQPAHQLICHIFDPQKRSFLKEDLIQQFGFPDVDFQKLQEQHWDNQPKIDFDDY